MAQASTPTPIDRADRSWFRANPTQNFRCRLPEPDEFRPDELAHQPGRGEPTVLLIASRAHGRVRRVAKMLRFKLPARGVA